jgi:hypothetical protein
MYRSTEARKEVIRMTDEETCSWCTTEVPDESLRETDDGARICPDCWAEYEDRTNPDQPEDDSCHCGDPDCGAC